VVITPKHIEQLKMFNWSKFEDMIDFMKFVISDNNIFNFYMTELLSLSVIGRNMYRRRTKNIKPSKIPKKVCKYLNNAWEIKYCNNKLIWTQLY